jgi:DNA invertase Pin-like site-specific DNA recombinase
MMIRVNLDEGIAVTTTIEQGVTEEQYALNMIQALTERIRSHQRGIEDCAKDRRGYIMALRDMKVTYRAIAEAMGTTEQNVYKILREYIAEQHMAKARQESDA